MRPAGFLCAVVVLLAGCAAPAPPGPPSDTPSDAPRSVSPSQAPPTSGASDPLHWSGTVEVTQSIFVPPWQTLRIDPGTTVRVHKLPDVNGTDWAPQADAFIKDHNDPTGRVGYSQSHFTIGAKVVAMGTKDAPILFTSAMAQPHYADWSQLVALSGSRLENVTIEYAHDGLNIQGSDVRVRNVTVHDSLWSCIDVFGDDVDLHDVEAYHCWHQAVGFKGPGARVLADAFLHDAQLAVNCEQGAQPVLERLRIRAAPLAPPCGPGDGTVSEPGGSDVAGGTYEGVLVYPANG